MASGLRALAPRVIVVAAVVLFATATITFAAANEITKPASVPSVAPAKPVKLTVPDVRGQVYVFAKGILEDAGFAWRLGPRSKGFAGYRVVSQYPEQGTKVIANGSPTIVLKLAADPRDRYKTAAHTSDDASPYIGDSVELATTHTGPRHKLHRAAPKAKAAVKKAAPKAKPAVQKKAKPVAKPMKKTAAPTRTAAFVVAGHAEPLDEMTLPARAQQLATWVAAHTQASESNTQHWLYQHAWITTGAKFGWWHGEQALRTLIAVDRNVQRQWGFGAKSQTEAEQALAFVQSHSK